MMLEKLSEKYADSIPNYNLIKRTEIATPVYNITVELTVLRKKEIGIVEEFIMKFINSGITDKLIISQSLGLTEQIINNSLASMISQNIVKSLADNTFQLTDKGKETLREAKLIVPEIMLFNFIIDALTGEVESYTRMLYDSKEVRSYKLDVIRPNIPKPNLENLDFNSINNLLKKMQKQNVSESFKGDLISVNKIEKCYISYRKKYMLIFKSNTDEMADLEIKIFNGVERETEYENIILRMENEGIRQIPFDKISEIDKLENADLLFAKIPSGVIEEAKFNTRKIELNKQKTEKLTQLLSVNEVYSKQESFDQDLESKISNTQIIRDLNDKINELKEQSKNINRFLETYQHRPILEEAFDNANKLILLVSPWMRVGVIDKSLENKIKKALSRGVKVIIGYGIAPVDETNEPALKRLNYIKKSKFGKNLELINLGNTHEKVLLVDGKYVVITSFNWLSFKGDPNRGFRQETGLYTIDKDTINNTLDSLEKRMGKDIKSYLN